LPEADREAEEEREERGTLAGGVTCPLFEEEGDRFISLAGSGGKEGWKEEATGFRSAW
jgi:hypothetical protein